MSELSVTATCRSADAPRDRRPLFSLFLFISISISNAFSTLHFSLHCISPSHFFLFSLSDFTLVFSLLGFLRRRRSSLRQKLELNFHELVTFSNSSSSLLSLSPPSTFIFRFVK
ncbi:hypothetical protein S83_023139 [Arachis hypogaea]